MTIPPSPIPRRLRRAAFVSTVVTSMFFASPAAHAQLAAPGEFGRCAASFLKGSSVLLKKRTDALLQCADRLLACRLADDLGNGDFGACSESATRACVVGFDKLTSLEDATRRKVAAGCTSLADPHFGDLLGLGFDRLLVECGQVSTADEAYDCLVSRVRCRAADMAESIHPRTYELFAATGLTTSHPEATSCLDQRSAPLTVTGDPSLLAACQKGMAKTVAKAWYKVPSAMGSCVGTLLECRLHEDHLLFDLEQPPACYVNDDAASSCQKANVGVSAARGTGILVKAASYCAGIPVADMLSSLNFEAECSGVATPTSLVDCARAAMAGHVLHLVDEVAPRTCQVGDESPWNVFSLGDFCASHCGNGVVEDDEACDDGNLDPDDACTNECAAGPLVM